MGVALFSDMLGVTFLGLLLTQVFYLLLRRRRDRSVNQKADTLLAPGSVFPAAH